MDKIKLFTNNKNNITQKIIDNNFNYVGSTYDTLQHNNVLKYSNHTTNISIDKYGVLIKTNPTNYIKPNNLFQIDRKELSMFKEQFESDLSINTDNFRLTGFDFNINVYTQYPPKAYLGTIRTLPKYKKTTYPYSDGITFSNDCKSFVLYDKIKQTVKNHINIPLIHQNNSVLRLELGVKGKMKETKNLSTINTLQDLTTPEKYILAVNEFQNIYNKIHKQPLTKFNMKIPNPQIISINEFALLFYINEMGMETYLNQLEQEKDMDFITYRQYKSRKDKALQLWQTYSTTTDSDTTDLLTELNQKVKETINNVKELAA